jgi:hypothetical protein
MKKLSAAVFLCLWLLFSLGCSSTPPGTVPLADLLSQGTERLGQNVVVVGMAETKTPLTSFMMFKLYDDGKSIWVLLPESVPMPPQGISVRVSGALQQKEFTVIGKTIYIDATKVAME